VLATLADIAERAAAAGIRAPAITLVGSVARLAEELAWVERRPLHGRTIVVTRARAQASGLALRLSALGAEVVEAPAIRIVPRPADHEIRRMVDEIGGYELICLTSPNGAAILMDHVGDARRLAGVQVAAIGPGTARELRSHGIVADVVSDVSTAEGLLDALATSELLGARVLVARASEARDVLPDGLRARGTEVDVVALYDTVAEHLGDDQLAAIERADYVTFTSSSTVRFFIEALDGNGLPNGAKVISIGPVTSDTARELGLEVHAEAARHDIDGLVDVLLAEAGGGTTA
jgi:uroporphyrinogen III methyltransferase/synthase